MLLSREDNLRNSCSFPFGPRTPVSSPLPHSVAKPLLTSLEGIEHCLARGVRAGSTSKLSSRTGCAGEQTLHDCCPSSAGVRDCRAYKQQMSKWPLRSELRPLPKLIQKHSALVSPIVSFVGVSYVI